MTVEQSGDNAVITAIDANGTTTATVSAGGSYRAGAGIDITDGVISATDAIDIDLSGYATETYVNNMISEIETQIINPYVAGDGIAIGSDNNEISVDKTVVATKTDLAAKQDILTAGENIRIENNVISAVGGGEGHTYTAGAGIDITNDEISVDNTVALKSELFSGDYNDLTNKPTIPDISGLATTDALTSGLATKQNTLTAGANITIENNVISSTASGGTTYTAGDNIDITNDVISVPDLEFTEPSQITGVDSKVKINGTEIYAGLEAQGNEVGYFKINPEEGGLFSGSTFYNKGIDMKPNGFTFKDTANDKEVTFAPTEDYAGFAINGDKIAVADDLASKQDVLTAGTGIDITGNVISATGGSGASYTAGEGIVIENNVISTSEKPVRIINVAYPNVLNAASDEDKEYIYNACINGLGEYPFKVYGTTEKS